MDANRLKQIYKLHGIDRIIEIILRKDDYTAGLEKRLEGLQYLGRFMIDGKNYSMYLREDK